MMRGIKRREMGGVFDMMMMEKKNHHHHRSAGKANVRASLLYAHLDSIWLSRP